MVSKWIMASNPQQQGNWLIKKDGQWSADSWWMMAGMASCIMIHQLVMVAGWLLVSSTIPKNWFLIFIHQWCLIIGNYFCAIDGSYSSMIVGTLNDQYILKVCDNTNQTTFYTNWFWRCIIWHPPWRSWQFGPTINASQRSTVQTWG